MKQLRIVEAKGRSESRCLHLPLTPRDPDVARAKQIIRARC